MAGIVSNDGATILPDQGSGFAAQAAAGILPDQGSGLIGLGGAGFTTGSTFVKNTGP